MVYFYHSWVLITGFLKQALLLFKRFWFQEGVKVTVYMRRWDIALFLNSVFWNLKLKTFNKNIILVFFKLYISKHLWANMSLKYIKLVCLSSLLSLASMVYEWNCIPPKEVNKKIESL